MRGHLASISGALRNLSLFTFVTGDFVSHKDPRVSNVRSSSSQSTLTAARAILALCLTLTPCLEIELSVTHCSLATALCPFIAGCHGPQGGGWSPHIMGHGAPGLPGHGVSRVIRTMSPSPIMCQDDIRNRMILTRDWEFSFPGDPDWVQPSAVMSTAAGVGW